MGLFNSKELKRISELENENRKLHSDLENLGAVEYVEVQEAIKTSKNFLSGLQSNIIEQKKILQAILDEIKQKQEISKSIDLDIEMMDFGIYTPKYNCMNSDEYSEKIKSVREQQKKLIREKEALNFFDGWTLDGNKAKGRAMNNDNMKMYLRAFNNECDVLISKVKFNNFDKIKDRIFKCAESLNKLNERNRISVKSVYLDLKIEELHLVHEYNCKKQEEKEAMRAAREEEREQAKLQKEIEEARKNVIKEQTHYEKAKEKLLMQYADTENEELRKAITEKNKDIDEKLEGIQKNLEDIDYREETKGRDMFILFQILAPLGKMYIKSE